MFDTGGCEFGEPEHQGLDSWGFFIIEVRPMIATTNLQQNMDKAFERRFLYKIKFEKPTEEARTSIWHSMIPELSELDVHTLASKYDFSGGQIENIARHYAIDCILHGTDDDTLSLIIAHCDNERLDQKESRKIGF